MASNFTGNICLACLTVSPLALRFTLTRRVGRFDKEGMPTKRELKYESFSYTSKSINPLLWG